MNGQVGEGGVPVQGFVVGVTFEADGRAILNLSDGRTLPLQQVASIQDAGEIVTAMIGRSVSGVDLRDPATPRPLQGLVTASRREPDGRWLLEMETGEDSRFRDVTAVGSAVAKDDSGEKSQGLISRISNGVLGG